METKTYALEAQLRAIRGHLHREGEPQADVEFYSRDIFKIQVKWNRIHDRDILLFFWMRMRAVIWQHRLPWCVSCYSCGKERLWW